MPMNILVSGAGGSAGVNFCNALSAIGKYNVFGTDYFRFHHVFPKAVMHSSPKHSNPDFIETLNKIIVKEKINFLHCAPTVEALQVGLWSVKCKTYLPDVRVMELAFDKHRATLQLNSHGVATPKLYPYEDQNFKFPIWVRARQGAGGAKSIKCFNNKDIEAWLHIWEHRGAYRGDFVFQEYVEGKDVAWDSLWLNGKLITSFARERIEYPSRTLGKGGSPTVARILHDSFVNMVGVGSVTALDNKPNGFYCVDMIQNAESVYVTEVNAGKAHTTLPLWGLAMQRKFDSNLLNLAYVYTELGLGNFDIAEDSTKFNLYPENYCLVRDVDCGSWLVHTDDKSKMRVDV